MSRLNARASTRASNDANDDACPKILRIEPPSVYACSQSAFGSSSCDLIASIREMKRKILSQGASCAG